MRRLLIILSFVVIFACQADDGGEPAPKASNGESQQTRKEEIQKWNLYVDLGNYMTGDFNPAMDEYFNRFGPGADYRPSGGQDQYMADFLSRLVDENHLGREIELALAKAAHSDDVLDQATYEMGVHLKEVWAELIKARDYYAAGQYESDNYAEAQEVHARIYEAYMSLSTTNTRFWDILTKEDAERRKRDIQEMVNQGLSLRPAMLEVIDKGQALQDLLNNLSITYGSLSSLEPEKFRLPYEEFNQSVASFEAALTAVGDKNNPEGLKTASLADFKRRVQEVKASAADLIELRRLKGSLDESPENISGTPEHFGRELGLLVDSYNAMAPAQ